MQQDDPHQRERACLAGQGRRRVRLGVQLRHRAQLRATVPIQRRRCVTGRVEGDGAQGGDWSVQDHLV